VNPAIVNFFEYDLYSTMRLTKGERTHIFNYMVEYMQAERLSKLLKAVSDTTRRDLLTRLCQQGASRVTDLASYYDMSLNAISKHIKVLESAGLVKRTTVGRSHLIEADLSQVEIMSDWFASLKSIWALSLEQLEKALNTGEEE
jgi:DNA-binding transcriptional ArsR family regulator